MSNYSYLIYNRFGKQIGKVGFQNKDGTRSWPAEEADKKNVVITYITRNIQYSSYLELINLSITPPKISLGIIKLTGNKINENLFRELIFHINM